MPKKKNKAQKTVEKISKNKYYVTFVVLMFLIIVVAAYFYRKQSDGEDSVGTESFSGQTVVETDAVRDLKITYIDVGQGDAVWIELPDGKNMLVDSGDRPTGNREKLDRVLSSEGVAKKIDYLVATHPDSDHIGQMSYIYENYEVGMTFRPFVKSEKAEADAFEGSFNDGISIGNVTEVYYSFLDAVRKEGTPYTFFYDGSDICGTAVVGETEYVYEIDFMMPHVLTLADYSKDNPNNFSAIFMLRYAGRNFLFTGDIGRSARMSTQKRALERNARIMGGRFSFLPSRQDENVHIKRIAENMTETKSTGFEFESTAPTRSKITPAAGTIHESAASAGLVLSAFFLPRWETKKTRAVGISRASATANEVE